MHSSCRPHECTCASTILSSFHRLPRTFCFRIVSFTLGVANAKHMLLPALATNQQTHTIVAINRLRCNLWFSQIEVSQTNSTVRTAQVTTVYVPSMIYGDRADWYTMYVRTTNLPSICLAVYAFRLLASVAAVVFPTPLQVRRTNACQRHYFRGHLVSVPHVRLYAWGIPHCQTVGRQRCCPIAYLCLRQTSAFRSFRSSTDGLGWCAVHLPCRC